MPFGKLFDDLKQLETFDGKNEIGLCYDLLIGAAYSLSKISDKNRFTKEEIFYDHSQRKALMHQFGGGEKSEESGKWLDGYYFANAGHRLVWIEERLNKILWQCPLCSDEQKNNRDFDYKRLLNVVPTHMEKNHCVPEKVFKKVWDSIYPNDPCVMEKIRDIFNSQKHDPEGLFIAKIEKALGLPVLGNIQKGFYEVIRYYQFIFLLENNKGFEASDLEGLKKFAFTS